MENTSPRSFTTPWRWSLLGLTSACVALAGVNFALESLAPINSGFGPIHEIHLIPVNFLLSLILFSACMGLGALFQHPPIGTRNRAVLFGALCGLHGLFMILARLGVPILRHESLQIGFLLFEVVVPIATRFLLAGAPQQTADSDDKFKN